MAEKFLETASQPSLPGRKDKAIDDFRVAQANCKLVGLPIGVVLW